MRLGIIAWNRDCLKNSHYYAGQVVGSQRGNEKGQRTRDSKFEKKAVSRTGVCCHEAKLGVHHVRSHGVMVSTQDFESCDPSSNLGGTLECLGIW